MVDSTNLPNVDINQIATDLNNKMDRDGVNATCPVVISRERKSDGTVEIWSDGYCVETGSVNIPGPGGATVTLTNPFVDTNYKVFTSGQTVSGGTMVNDMIWVKALYTDHFYIDLENASHENWCYWRAEGYIR